MLESWIVDAARQSDPGKIKTNTTRNLNRIESKIEKAIEPLASLWFGQGPGARTKGR